MQYQRCSAAAAAVVSQPRLTRLPPPLLPGPPPTPPTPLCVCAGAGVAFGNVPAVQSNFSLVLLGVVAVSLLPVAWEVVAARREADAAAPATPIADPLEEQRINDCEEDPSAKECRVYDD